MKSKLIVCLVIISVQFVFAQSVYKVENTSSIAETFNKVIDKNKTSFFVGYSTTTNEEKLTTCGSFWIDDSFVGTKLKDLVNGKSLNKNNGEYGDVINNHIKFPLKIYRDDSLKDFSPDKETAVIFYYEKGAENIDDFKLIYLVNISLQVDISNLPLYWLGNQDYNASFDFLVNQFKQLSENDKQDEMLASIALHRKLPQTTSFLIDVVRNSKDDNLREEAILWLGQQDNLEAFNTLKEIAYSNQKKEIREEAVMGLAQLTIQEGVQEVIKIAKSHNESFLREEAIMWLGQFASNKVEKELKDIIENDPEIELKKQALYALSESDKDMVPYLIDIATNHPSLTLKKHAIYMLGDSYDERAVDALIKLATK